MAKNKFKIGDNVIGNEYPDDIPAKVIELVDTPHEHGFVVIEFQINGNTKTAMLPEYRLKYIRQ